MDYQIDFSNPSIYRKRQRETFQQAYSFELWFEYLFLFALYYNYATLKDILYIKKLSEKNLTNNTNLFHIHPAELFKTANLS